MYSDKTQRNIFGMTASEIIQEIKAMSAQERERVMAFLLQYEKDQTTVHYADDQAANEASDRVLKKHAKLMRKLAS